jgi:hypothetical protein
MAESAHVVSFADSHLLREIQRALKAIGRRFKWLQQCLVQAMAAQWMP